MALLLLFVPSTFLTIISFSNFYSLNLCLAAILLSINILVALLSKSAFTVMPSCVSNFSTLILIHISLSILKVFLTSFWLLSSLAVLSDSLGHALLCCTFSSVGHATFFFSFFWHPHYLCLSLIIPCLLFFFIWHLFSPHLSYYTYVTITVKTLDLTVEYVQLEAYI